MRNGRRRGWCAECWSAKNRGTDGARLNSRGEVIVGVNGSRVAAHRLVAEEQGWTLASDMRVRHRDGDRANNDPANLEVCVWRPVVKARRATGRRRVYAVSVPEEAADALERAAEAHDMTVNQWLLALGLSGGAVGRPPSL